MEDNKVNTGFACAIFVLHYHNLSFNPQNIIHQFGSDDTFDSEKIVLALRSFDLKTKVSKFKNKKDILKCSFPVIAKKKDGEYIFLGQYQEKDNKVLYQDPLIKQPQMVDADELLELIEPEVILATKRVSLLNEDFKFGIGWFVEAFLKYKKMIVEVLVASFFIQILSLLSPLFFQIVTDKVLVHNSLTTLDILIIGLLVVSIFEVVLSILRTYILNHTTNKVDVTLSSHLYNHLMLLPLNYFSTRKVGQIAARVGELDTVRAFITSSALTLCIDLFFTIIFFSVMWFYSKTLTLIVMASIPFYVLIAAFVTPILRKKLDDKFMKGAENQAFLVESITGAQTIKSLALEPKMKEHWDNQISNYTMASFKVNNLGNFYSQTTSLISKITTLLILYYGAKLVLDGDLTIGMLIAFNMLANRVSGPILKLSQLWNDFQQANISIKRLSDILNNKKERGHDGSKIALKNIAGNIKLDNVSFRYKADSKTILEDINLNINAGEVIGIVGRSGSGKSTLTKLIQRLYVTSSGRILIDDLDISTIDPAWLRRQIGVVLQDNFLFSKSIKDNIAISNPSMPIDTVIQAAKLSGAHDFISDLPDGYDTIIEEQGSNLSGGQKQRIAIARALINNPRILIFDEATSALDYESEAIIQNNMKMICRGRTVIIIAHRLTAVKDANRIIVMDKGKIVEQGPEDFLLQKENGLYRKLHDHQAKGKVV